MLERIHLSIVQQVDKLGSMTAAAEALHLTQSAISHSMRKLEEQLGTDIWLREGRSLRLTQAGQYLLQVASRVLPQLVLAETRIGQYAEGERGTLRIGMLLSGELAPNEVVTERQIALQLGISRTPLREAVRRLEGERLLERQRSGALVVRALPIEEYMHGGQQYVRLLDVEIG